MGPRRGGRRLVVVGVVPARYGSSRWPGKALAVIDRKPLVLHAWETLMGSVTTDRVVIATDDDRIARAAERAGAEVVRTSHACRNGTERVAEVAERIAGHVFVNVQADQVGLEPRLVDTLVRAMQAHPEWPMATLATRDGLADARRSPDRVIVNDRGRGVAFSFRRGDGLAAQTRDARHLGVYGYRAEALRAYARASVTAEELSASLEQLRAMSLGWEIGVVRVRSNARSLDRPDDLNVTAVDAPP